ncbi:MAG: hypothetical protein A3B22_00285 [Candidatus Zambryskibacteria bacterium RIFCSPLOWO2_01_FULL_47_33]|nr:MAG: hypothetical protein A3B22_00285 [Candidatus Zambryskibacteria bacterium RIFCSPLOWO2_01_FULL_47_33]
MNNKIIVIIVIAVLAVGGFLLFKSRGLAPTEIIETRSNMPVGESDVEETEVVEEAAQTNPTGIKEFSIDEVPFSLSPSTITVNRGDTVRITVKNKQGTHDLKIDEFNASTRVLNVGEEQIITFVADKVGVFEYYCSVGNHRAQGMVGTLRVR